MINIVLGKPEYDQIAEQLIQIGIVTREHANKGHDIRLSDVTFACVRGDLENEWGDERARASGTKDLRAEADRLGVSIEKYPRMPKTVTAGRDAMRASLDAGLLRPNIFERLSISIETIREAQRDLDAMDQEMKKLHVELSQRPADAPAFLRTVQDYSQRRILPEFDDMGFWCEIVTLAGSVAREAKPRSERQVSLIRIAELAMRWSERISREAGVPQ